MTTYHVAGRRVTLHRPRVADEGVGHLWYPNLYRLPSGELILNHQLSADSDENLLDLNRIMVSRDDGRTFERRFDVPGFSGGTLVDIARRDGALGRVHYHARFSPRDQRRVLVAHYERIEDHGRRYVLEPDAARVLDLPRDVQPFQYKHVDLRDAKNCFHLYGNAVDTGGVLITIAHGRFEGDEKLSAVALTSANEGYTWRYLGTVGPPDAFPDAREGPNESTLVRLADGDLLAVLRIGGRQDDLVRSYSADGGRSWSALEPIPAGTVAPCLRRLSDGLLALGTGRPGLFLWLSADGRGASWEPIDVTAHHNATLDAAHQIRPKARGSVDPEEVDQTTAYTALLELGPGRLLMAYDRVPFGWKPTPVDSAERSRVYLLDVDIT